MMKNILYRMFYKAIREEEQAKKENRSDNNMIETILKNHYKISNP